MIQPSSAIHQNASCPICGRPLKVVSAHQEGSAEMVEGEPRFPARYRCSNPQPHCWEDVLRPEGRRERVVFELAPRRCGHDERYGGSEVAAATPGPRSHPD